MKKPLPDRIASLQERQTQIAAKLSLLQARAKQAERKRDTRRKIVVGAAVLSEMERTPMFAKFVREMLAKAVTRPQDQEAIADLLAVSHVPAPANAPGSPAASQEQLAG